MTVGDRIKKAIDDSEYTHKEIADKIGIKKQTLNKYENNTITNIPSNKIEMIAVVLGISPAYLMGWEDNLSVQKGREIPDIMSDSDLLKHIEMLMVLSKEHKDKVYNDIEYWYKHEGH